MTCQPRSLRTTLLTLPLAALLLVSLNACGGAQKTDDSAATAKAELPASAVCVVSGKTFKPTAETPKAVYQGKTYYLCCPGCAKKFAANPEKYAAAKPECDDCKKEKKAEKDCDDCKKGEKKADCDDCGKEKKKADCGDCDKKKKADCDDCDKKKKADCDDCKKDKSTASALPASAVCPVSGKTFKPTAETPKATYKGKTYYLCCPGCAKKFNADPAKFAKS